MIDFDHCVLHLSPRKVMGSIWPDLSRYKNNGRIYGAQLRHGAMYFNGENAYIRVPDSPALRPSYWTIVIWFKSLYTVGSDIGYYPFILSKYRGEQKGYWMVIGRTDQNFGIGTGNGTKKNEIWTKTLDNNWHMLTGQLTETKLIAYYDLDKYEFTLNVTPVVSLHDLYIGAKDAAQGYVKCYIGDILMFDTILSEQRLRILYNLTSPYGTR